MSEVFASYEEERQRLLTLLNQLRASGVDGELDLPRITIIGNQSAGKSSVVEAISCRLRNMHPLPHGMSNDQSPWSCRISIRRAFSPDGRTRLDDISEDQFGSIIYDENEVEDRLRKAQVYVLNNMFDEDELLAASVEQVREWGKESAKKVPFSKNVVCVSLEGPDLTDLSFMDLPGLIQTADDPKTIDLVKDMVQSNIQGNSLILVAIPMTDDIQNQGALQLAKQPGIDPRGLRTIGVLTKPDMLTTGASGLQRTWLDVLEGRSDDAREGGIHHLHHGYFCTRQPNDQDRASHITHAEARENEENFFATTAPWSSSSRPGRFGTKNLVDTLSTQLIRLIRDALPKIDQQATDQLRSITTELNTIPPAPTEEPTTIMQMLVTSFCADVERYVQGGTSCASLVHANRDAFIEFQETILATAPKFLIQEKRSRFSARVGGGEGIPEGPMTLGDMKVFLNDAITRELRNNVPFDAKKALIVRYQTTWPAAVETCFYAVQDAMHKHLLALINKYCRRYDRLSQYLTMLIPELESRHQARCETALSILIEKEETPYTQNSHYLDTSIDKFLARYKAQRASSSSTVGGSETSSGVFGFSSTPSSSSSSTSASPQPATGPSAFAFGASGSKTTSSAFGASADAAESSAAKPASKMGGFQAFNFPKAPAPQPAPSAFGSSKPAPAASAFDNSTQSTKNPAPAEPDADKLAAALSALAALGYEGLTSDDLSKLIPPDPYENEMKVMAEISGYFKVAYKRVIDDIPAVIDLTYVKAISKDLQLFLIAKLGVGTAAGNERLSTLLAEDMEVVARRDELIGKKKRLENVRAELDNFAVGV